MKRPVSLLILHQLPLEYYPPVTNLIDYLMDRGGFKVRAVSTSVPAGMEPYSHVGVPIRRGFEVPVGRMCGVSRMVMFTLAALWQILRWRPDAILYYESHSSLPVWLSRRILRSRTPLFIHYHELYCPEDFVPRGHRMTRFLGGLESKFLYPQATWISQTNERRLEIFSELHPSAPKQRLRTLPNFPPESWRGKANRRWGRPSPVLPIRLVYVGALSLETTYLEEVCRWVAGNPGIVTLDIFGFRVPDPVSEFLGQLDAENVRLAPHGIPYRDLPKRLPDYHVGLILYRGHTLNFVYNCPNKLFEYLACGLDVWYPKEMLGIRAMRRESSFPKVLEIDFSDLDLIDAAALVERRGLDADPDKFFCADSFERIAQEIETAAVFPAGGG